MELSALQLPPHHRAILNRFVTACQTDERITAACLIGSYAKDTADAYSDLDLYLVINDEEFEGFLTEQKAFMSQLGELLFLENFGLPQVIFFVFADGTEGEINCGRVSDLPYFLYEPYQVLLDKKQRLAGLIPAAQAEDQAEAIETVRRQINWFWHDLSHFIVALGRGQHHWAYGQLEALRHYCLNLARLQQDIFDGDVGDEAFFKVEQTLAAATLAPLQATYCPLEPAAMLQAVFILLPFYRERAITLAQTHHLPYPDALDRVVSERLDKLSRALIL